MIRQHRCNDYGIKTRQEEEEVVSMRDSLMTQSCVCAAIADNHGTGIKRARIIVGG